MRRSQRMFYRFHCYPTKSNKTKILNFRLCLFVSFRFVFLCCARKLLDPVLLRKGQQHQFIQLTSDARRLRLFQQVFFVFCYALSTKI